MRFKCPLCGERELREFTYKENALALDRPATTDWGDDWHAYIHLRENPAGRSRELWQHSAGCAAWLIVERDTQSHEV